MTFERASSVSLVAGFIHTGLGHPAWRAATAVSAGAGVLAAAVPVGFLGADDGAGLTGGAHYGLLGACAAAPAVAVLLTTAVSAGADERGISRELFLAGIGGFQRAVSTTLAAVVLVLLALLAAPVVGAVAGLGDSLRQHSAILTEADPLPALYAAGTAIWFALITACVASIERRGLPVIAMLAGGGALFFLGLILSRDISWARDVLAATPFGPFWSLAYHNPNDATFTLEMSRDGRLAVLCGWPLALGALAASTLRRPPR